MYGSSRYGDKHAVVTRGRRQELQMKRMNGKMVDTRRRAMSLLLLEFLCLLLVAGEALLIGARSDGGGSGSGSDKKVLVELKRFLQGNNRVNRGGYDAWPETDPSPCGWSGVRCDGAGRVASLNLSGSSISGAAFGNFSRLPALASLDLSYNSITGALPAADLNQCRGLVHLNLSHNLITGSLDLSGLTRLRELDVSGNRLEGGVAGNFPAICADLAVLDLSTNRLTGNITGLFDGCVRLDHVDLSSNKFTGELWPGVARFTKFSAAENNLTGSIPSSTFPDGCKLQSLDLSANQLLGNFPDSISKCNNLTYMSLWGNKFAGMIPAGIGELAALETLILGKNQFDRRIPQELTNCTSLQFLDISNNAFGGDIQQIFSKLVSLRHLVLHHNNYTGGIVASGVLRLPLLARLDLSYNEIVGDLPPEVADMKGLRYLMLAENNFSGGIPPLYGRLAELQALDLSNNKLSGGIPASLGNLTSLLWLMLAGNQLSGEIPPEIGNCTSLLWLNLADNRLNGTIPPEMAEIGRNPGPTFAKNRNDSSVLAGSGECQAMKRWVPASYPPFSFVYSVMTRKNCRSIWAHILRGVGIIPICTNAQLPVRSNGISGYVQLSGNLLSGEIPSQFGAMRNLSLLHLDRNRLTGKLPPEIGQLPLVMLNVSRNNMSGLIPSEIGHNLCFERMDLSYNNLSGELPASLNQLTDLIKFNVSYNPLLSGDVPTTGQFGTFDEQSFLGDPHISLHKGGAAGNQPPPEAMDEPPTPEALSDTVLLPRITAVLRFFFFLMIGFIAGTFLDLGRQVLNQLCDVIVEQLRDRAVTGLLQASLDGLFREILDGVPTRVFSPSDAPLLEEDLETLKEFFISGGDGLPRGTVENLVSRICPIINLIKQETRVLIDDLREVTQGGKSKFGTDSKTLLRVLCHRNDSEASHYVKKHFKIPSSAPPST